MKNKFLIWWPLFFLFITWFAFASPFFLKGKIPFPADYQVTFFPPWSQYAQFNMPVKNSAMPDVIDQLYPWKHIVINDWKSGQIPLWNPYNFAGTPLMANYQSAAFTPLNILFFLFSFPVAWGLLVVFQPFLAGIGMYIFARKINISQVGATLSSLAFMFCGFIVTWMGYATLGYAVSVLPVVLIGLEQYAQTKKFLYALLTSGALFLSFVSGHFQMSLYVLLAAFLYVLFRYLPAKNIKTIVVGLGSIAVGFLLAAPQIFPSIAFYAQSLRSSIFSRPEVIPWQYLFTIVAPDFFGNPVTRNDWFGHYAEWSSYIGVMPLLFALFSLTLFWKNKFITFFSLLGLFALLLATPTFLGDLILHLHIPVLATSAAGRIMILLSFSFAVLAGLGFDHWMQSGKKKKMIVVFLAGFFLIIGWTVILGKIGMPIDKIIIAKQNFILPSMFLSLAIILTTCLVFLKNKRLSVFVTILFLMVSAFDMYRFSSKWQSFNPQSLIFPNIGITNFFQKIQGNRVLGNYGGQVSLYYQLPSLEGYDALYPENFGEFASYVANGSFTPASRSVVDFPKNGRYTKEAINLLGINYVVHKISDTGKSWTFPVWDNPNDFQVAYQDNAYIVFKNLKAFPRAFIAGDYAVAVGDKKILPALFASGIDTQKTLILEKNPGIAKMSYASGSASIDSYAADAITITTSTKNKALLFLSDTYFPGWHAYVDGKETEILRADYTFRAIVVPSGTHTVIFSYWPDSLAYGLEAGAGGIFLISFLYFFQKKRA